MKTTDQIGIIGFGSMGTMLAEGLLRTGAVPPNRLKIFTRTVKRARGFARLDNDITVCDSVQSAVSGCTVVLLCVPPDESPEVLGEIGKTFEKNQILVSIVGSLTLDLMERVFPHKIVRMVPSITAEVDEGTFVISCNEYCTDGDINKIRRLFGYMGEVVEVNERKIEAFTDLTSCGPGILSALFQEYVNSAVRIGKVSEKEAIRVFTQTLYGLSKLYVEDGTDFETVIKRVARKGGTTEIGIEAIRRSAPACFDEVFYQTLEHQKKRKNDLRKAIAGRLNETIRLRRTIMDGRCK